LSPAINTVQERDSSYELRSQKTKLIGIPLTFTHVNFNMPPSKATLWSYSSCYLRVNSNYCDYRYNILIVCEDKWCYGVDCYLTLTVKYNLPHKKNVFILTD